MSAGYGGGLPDYTGGTGSGSSGDGGGGGAPYGRDPAPYSQAGLSPQDAYAVGTGGADPYAPNPYANDPYAPGTSAPDPYASDPYANDASVNDQLEADGFGPVFSSSVEAQSGGYAVAPYGSQQPYGPYSSGAQGYGQYAPAVPSSGAGITGFVLGLLALTMCGGLTAPFGIFFSLQGMTETSPIAMNPKSGRGLAVAGLVLSLVGLIPLLLLVLYVAFFVVAIMVGATSA